jgi:hypothetical protein
VQSFFQREVFVCGLAVLAGGACASQQSVSKKGLNRFQPKPKGAVKKMPDWVMRTPSIAKTVCAVGAVDPTFYRDDGRRNASDAARNELAKTVQVKISSVMYDEINSHGGGWTSEVSVQQIVGSISDVVLSGAQISEVWFDEHGVVDREGMTYAMACMPTDKSMQELAAKLEAVGSKDDPDHQKRIQRVKANAAKAFDELENLEAKKSN